MARDGSSTSFFLPWRIICTPIEYFCTGAWTMSNESKVEHREALKVELERALIDEYLRGRGYDRAALERLPEEQRRSLLADADVYASGKLTEVEARSHLLDAIHDGSPKSGRD